MSVRSCRIPIKAWYGDEEMELTFPSRWDVVECRMAGHDAIPMTDEEISTALKNPMGTQPLKELARGKKDVVILFDDLTRPAPTWKILPFVIRELRSAGIEDEHIRFVAAYANHAAMRLNDFTKKLGRDIVKRFRIYNHNPYDHLVDLGKTTRGTPIFINREVMACDLKIGIGGLIPHRGAGFGGGAKLVLPGVAGISATDHNHRVLGGMAGEKSKQKNLRLGMGVTDIREDMEEAARVVGLDLKIDLLVNNRREITGLYAGDFIEQHRAGVETARKMYATPVEQDCDIVVTNAYPIENLAIKAIWPGHISLKTGGTVVMVAQSVEGIAPHYLAGRFGTDFGGEMWAPATEPIVPHAGRILLCSAYHSLVETDFWGPPGTVIPCETWGEVMVHLLSDYPDSAKVSVYPYASIQMPAEGSGS